MPRSFRIGHELHVLAKPGDTTVDSSAHERLEDRAVNRALRSLRRGSTEPRDHRRMLDELGRLPTTRAWSEDQLCDFDAVLDCCGLPAAWGLHRYDPMRPIATVLSETMTDLASWVQGLAPPRDFDVCLRLGGPAGHRVLTPLRAPSYADFMDGDNHSRDHVCFELEIEDSCVDRVFYEIFAGTGTGKRRLLQREGGSDLRTMGTHEIVWDGYDDDGILDTKVLKDPNLEIKATAILDGVTKNDSVRLRNDSLRRGRWVDVKVCRRTKSVEVEMRVNLQDGGAEGVGEPPPETSSFLYALPPSDPRRWERHVRARSIEDLLGLAREGLVRYWGRNASNGLSVSTPEGAFTFTIAPLLTQNDALEEVKLVYNTNRRLGRSSNPARVRGGLSLIGQVAPQQIIYNIGWLTHDRPIRLDRNIEWFYLVEDVADENFRQTAAHELGHEILQSYGGDAYSYRHRGSSIAQGLRSLDRGGRKYPETGEIDLMMYYHESPLVADPTRLVASEVDVRGLLWLARVQFG